MAITFATSKWAYLANANWMDNVDSFSVAGWVRFDTITTGNKQFVFSHRGTTNKFSLRKESTTDNWKFSVTAGGVNKLVDVGPDPVVSTVYHVACTWKKAFATGMKLYVDGSLLGTTDTTTQTANYDSGGASPWIFCSETDAGSNFGVCTLEGWTVWSGYVLDATEVTQHRYNAWPGALSIGAPGAFWSFLTGTTTAKDWGAAGQQRHLTLPSGVTATTNPIGKWERPTRGLAGTAVGATTTAPPGENPWLRWGTVTAHPGSTRQLTGLTNGTMYDLRVVATDTSGNESAPSPTVTATPTSATVIHRRRRRLLG